MSITNVALTLGVNESTLRNWENNRRQVSLRFRRRVHEFLGLCPYDASLKPSERLRERREFFGITRKQMAEMFDIDAHTVAAWENNDQQPTLTNMQIVSKFLSRRFP